MKNTFLILFVLPFILFGQEQSPCYSVNDYNISILENNPPLTMNLNEGWNMIGYPCVEPMQVEDALISIVDELLILKDNYGDVYWPEYGFNGIGSLKQLNGYQINLLESVENFSFCSTVELTERNGCTDCEAFNFDIWATLDDGSCLDVVEGCTDALAFNFNELANTEDGSCIPITLGCTDPNAFNYNLEANTEFDPTNCEAFVLGCMDSTAYNYNTDANTDDDSCEAVVEGCTDATAFNYISSANTDDGSCEAVVSGCTNISYVEYDPSANTDDNSCENLIVEGCMDSLYLEYSELVNISDSTQCITLKVVGCTDVNYTEYNADANVSDSTLCVTLLIEGCTDADALNYNAAATNDDGSCISVVSGCTNASAFNYNAAANTDDNSCEAVIEGCTDATAFNYNASANTDNGSCEAVVVGCSDITAINFNVEANIDDGTCIFQGCTDANYFEYNIFASQDDGSCQTLKIYGCIYPLAINFNENANTEDGSCVFYETPIGETNGGECDLPIPFQGNTGSNMTVMLTSAFITSLNATDENAYIVALTEAGLVVGSKPVYGVTQTSWGVWGDDAQTIDVDGALANEAISFQLVNGTDLYDVVMPSAVSFLGNGLSVQNAAAILIPADCQSYACPYDVYLEYMSNADNYDIVYCVNLIVEGCTGEMYFEFNPDANVEDGSCLTLIVEGCTDINYAEYSAEANTDDGSCLTLAISGCTNPDANNYNPNANTDDGSCIVLGCMQMTAANYNFEATENDGSCIYYGCINSTAENFESTANTDDGSCIIYGCALSVFPNYNSQATIDDGSCDMSSTDVFGCTNITATNYNASANIDNGICQILGCMEMNAPNYNASANIDNGSCQILGCMEMNAANYNASANIDNGSCQILGCMEMNSANYTATANTDDGSCALCMTFNQEAWHLPDGSGEFYSTDIELDCFGEGQTLTDVNDIVGIFATIEHSYLGDLHISIVAPNGVEVFLTDGEGSNTWLGSAVDNEVLAEVGVGEQYGWSMNPDYNGNMGAGAIDNKIPNPEGNIVSPDFGGTTIGDMLSPGTYLPNESFDALLGTPLNGTWTINLEDDAFSDDGWIFSWRINIKN